jgi:acyl carrier protein
MSQHFDKVKEIILEHLDLEDDSKITMEASFDNDLGADSIAKFELINALEEEFDLEIDDDVAQTLTTVTAVCKFLDEQVG